MLHDSIGTTSLMTQSYSEALSGLEENFSSLGQASEGMLDQAKRLATEQSAKGWFGRKFGLG